MTKSVTAAELKAMLRDGRELALIDVREEGAFSAAHTFLACSIPLSRIELSIRELVPRQSTRIVLIDDNDGLSQLAAAKLAQYGYGDVAILQNGMDGWRAAGFEVFSGVNVPSKAFGEFVEQTYHTPHIAASDLKARMERGEKMVILDSRPIEEYRRMHIPTGIDAPGAELVYRVFDAAPDPDTLVVVNCAGRTRSIIGAQSLINAGIPNKVMALENGTMGWHLAGQELAAGEDDRRAPLPSKDGLAKAKQAAERVAQRFGVTFIDRATLAQWQAERDTRTLFLLDVRSPEEYAQGHLPDCVSAPGGQLVQATDEYVGVRNARIVLVDDTEVRAIMTASWLVQMGWDVHVLKGGIGAAGLTKDAPKQATLDLPKADMISAQQLQHLLHDKSVAVLDLGSSVKYRDNHIPGAWWGVRSRLAQALQKIGAVKQLILVSSDGVLAQLAAGDLKHQRPDLAVKVLEGGSKAWFGAGRAGENGLARATTETNDVWYKPYENRDAMEQSMRDYITWEIALIPQIARDGDANFRKFI